MQWTEKWADCMLGGAAANGSKIFLALIKFVNLGLRCVELRVLIYLGWEIFQINYARSMCEMALDVCNGH